MNKYSKFLENNYAIVGNKKYIFVSKNKILIKEFKDEELQEICASLILGYEKDGDPNDLFEEIFREPKSFDVIDNTFQVELEIGKVNLKVSEPNFIFNFLDSFVKLENEKRILEMKMKKYKNILIEQNLLRKSYEPDIKEFTVDDLIKSYF